MLLVVADTGPIRYLVKIDQIDLLAPSSKKMRGQPNGWPALDKAHGWAGDTGH